MSDEKPSYMVRNKDGILEPNSEATWLRIPYKDPGEAALTWHAGKQKFGCTHSVFSNYRSHPCGKTAKYDPDHNGNPTKCGHHSKAALEREKVKAAERKEKWEADWDFKRKQWAYLEERDEIIRKIANGHNDPRGLCQDWLDRKPVRP